MKILIPNLLRNEIFISYSQIMWDTNTLFLFLNNILSNKHKFHSDSLEDTMSANRKLDKDKQYQTWQARAFSAPSECCVGT